jgi:hypothetical protein
MPKDEFDFDDPMELNGVAMFSEEDTTDAMTECFIEEFMRLGHNHTQLLALFRNPHFIGINMVLANRGETYVKQKIEEIFARWGKRIEWPATPTQQQAAEPGVKEQQIPLDQRSSDPTGGPVSEAHDVTIQRFTNSTNL